MISGTPIPLVSGMKKGIQDRNPYYELLVRAMMYKARKWK